MAAPIDTDGATPLLAVRDVVVQYGRKGWGRTPVEILHGVNMTIRPGETVGLVGESGSGKTTLGRAVLGLVPITVGRIEFRGQRIDHVGGAERRKLARHIQVVFQDPYTSLNPAKTINQILTEPLGVQGISKKEARDRVGELLARVALPGNAGDRYPREFSGGQRQRVAIARALALSPELIVCDEPVSALDLSTQAKVLDLLLEIQQRTGVAYLFISHDLSVVRHISHRVAVIYRGDIVEYGDADTVTRDPADPYTRRLLMAAPVPDPIRQTQRRADRHAEKARAADESAVVA